MPTLVAYISGHGFGHASRTVEVLAALAARAPALRLVVRSQAAPWLVAHTAPRSVTVQQVAVDTGAVQFDSLTLDIRDTVRQADRFMAAFADRLAVEVQALRSHDATLVVADIPALGVAAARAAGVPAVMLGNFTWDWIYAAYPGGSALAAAIGEIYAKADLALRLPLSGGFDTCPHIIDLPFIARRSRRDAVEVRQAFALPTDERLVLVSFGGFGVHGLDLDALGRLDGYRVIVTGRNPTPPATGLAGGVIHLDEMEMYARGYRYEDLVRAVDVVATKPGYGIIAEAIANQTALLYTSRGHFAEYDVLVGGMPRYLRVQFIGQEDLLAGGWQPHLDALMAQPPPPERPRVDGAEVAANLLLRMM
ncbi:MAG TPA: hypothetical protein PLH72_07895 [Vicinamibacterales bacterium]|nr:hypothetical protein [Vicinamibacterales bacterium]